MKRIMFLTTNFLPSKLGGSEEFIRLLAENNADNYEITVVTHRGKDLSYWWNPFTEILPKEEVINNIRIIRLRNNHLKNLIIIIFKLLFKVTGDKIVNLLFSKNFIEYINLYIGPQFIGLEKFLKKNIFDTIHVGPMPYEFCLYLIKIHKKLNLKSKLITTPFFHETQNIYYSKCFEDYLKSCDVIHLVSNPEKENLLKAFNVPENIIKVIPLFLDLSEFTEDSLLETDVQNFKENFNLKDKVIILGFNRGGREAKGIEYTINALNDLADKYKNLCLIVLGDKLDKKAQKINSELQIIELGYIYGRNKEVIFKVCDIFSMPSQVESFGLMYLEAWLRKKPVLAFELSPLKKLIDDGGVLCRIRDQQDVTESLKKLIENKDLRYSMGLSGYKMLKEYYLFESVFKKYSSILE